MKKLFLRAEFGPLWEPWEEDEIGRKALPLVPAAVLEMFYQDFLNPLRRPRGFRQCGAPS